MTNLFAAVAQAASDTVDTVKAALPELPEGLRGIPPEVWQKLSSEQIADIIEEAMESSWMSPSALHGVLALLIPIGSLVLTGVVIWLLLRFITARSARRHEETLAMIDKGIYQAMPPKVAYHKERYLLWGLILAGIGLAFSIGAAVVEDGMITPGLLFLFPGLGLVAFYLFLAKRQQPKPELEASQRSASPPEVPPQGTDSP